MAKPTPRSSSKPDQSALRAAVQEALNDYANEDLSARDVVIEYEGNMSRLAQQLAGVRDKVGRAYRNQMQNIRRWLKGERQPSKESLEKLRAARVANISNMNIIIHGEICISDECEERTIGDKTPINISGGDLEKFLNQVAENDIDGAYQTVFDNYLTTTRTGSVGGDPYIQISFE
jgi:hypothetical protein